MWLISYKNKVDVDEQSGGFKKLNRKVKMKNGMIFFTKDLTNNDFTYT
jgi:hypothetical protein